MLVPLNVAALVGPAIPADMMETPGAKMSTQVPKFVKDARLSVDAVAPTVTTLVLYAGEKPHALDALFPAATTTVMPTVTRSSKHAVRVESTLLPPREAETTAGEP